MIDSHTHLFLCEGREDELVEAAGEVGVERILNVGLGRDSNETALAATRRHGSVFATAGCHPTSADEFDDELGAEIWRLAQEPKVLAVGETGIDLYRESASLEAQQVAFVAQVEIADRFDLPIVIHARDPDGQTGAVGEVFNILDQHPTEVPVILHCFLAPWRVEDAIERGWYCSFSGIVTFPKSAELRAAAAKLPADLLLVETDAPYLAPQPVRGKPNEPAHVVLTAREVAEARGEPYEQLEETVEANAKALFGW
jgi:TatD DNase family protein